MPEIKVRNVNGKLVGIDENGNQVELEFEDTVHDSVNTGDISINGYQSVAVTTGDVVTSDGGRYDPANYADIGAAVNDAMSNTSAPGAVWLPAGKHTYSTDMVVDKTYIDLLGPGVDAAELNYTGSGAAVTIDGAGRNTIQAFTVQGDGTAGQDGILVDSANSPVSHHTVRDIVIFGTGRYGFYENADGNNQWQGEYDNILFGGTGNHAFYAERSNSAGIAERIIDRFRSAGNTIGGDFIHDIGSGKMRKFYRSAAEPNVSGKGYYIQADKFHTVKDCKAEGTGDDGFFFYGTDDSTFENLWSYNTGGYGVTWWSSYTGCWMNEIHASSNTDGDVFFGGNGTINGNTVGAIPGGYTSAGGDQPDVDLFNGKWNKNIHLKPRASAPSGAAAGDIAMQDGSTWNPTGSGSVEPVYYDGSTWNAT